MDAAIISKLPVLTYIVFVSVKERFLKLQFGFKQHILYITQLIAQTSKLVFVRNNFTMFSSELYI